MSRKNNCDENHQEPVAQDERCERAKQIVDAYYGDEALERSRIAFKTVMDNMGGIVPPDSSEGRYWLAGVFVFWWMNTFPIRARDASKVPNEICKYLRSFKSDIPKDKLYPHDLINELRVLGLAPREYVPLIEDKWYAMDKNERIESKNKLTGANKKHNSRYNISLKRKKRKKKV